MDWSVYTATTTSQGFNNQLFITQAPDVSHGKMQSDVFFYSKTALVRTVNKDCIRLHASMLLPIPSVYIGSM